MKKVKEKPFDCDEEGKNIMRHLILEWLVDENTRNLFFNAVMKYIDKGEHPMTVFNDFTDAIECIFKKCKFKPNSDEELPEVSQIEFPNLNN